MYAITKDFIILTKSNLLNVIMHNLQKLLTPVVFYNLQKLLSPVLFLSIFIDILISRALTFYFLATLVSGHEIYTGIYKANIYINWSHDITSDCHYDCSKDLQVSGA